MMWPHGDVLLPRGNALQEAKQINEYSVTDVYHNSRAPQCSA